MKPNIFYEISEKVSHRRLTVLFEVEDRYLNRFTHLKIEEMIKKNIAAKLLLLNL